MCGPAVSVEVDITYYWSREAALYIRATVSISYPDA
jgi:hypothetical protein